MNEKRRKRVCAVLAAAVLLAAVSGAPLAAAEQSVTAWEAGETFAEGEGFVSEGTQEEEFREPVSEETPDEAPGLVPEETEPIPEEIEPTPEETEPIPEETEPTPEETEPIPEETEEIMELIPEEELFTDEMTAAEDGESRQQDSVSMVFHCEYDLLQASVSVSGLSEALPQDTELRAERMEAQNHPEAYEAAISAVTENALSDGQALGAVMLLDFGLYSGEERVSLEEGVQVQVTAQFDRPLFETEEVERAAELLMFAVNEPESGNAGEAGEEELFQSGEDFEAEPDIVSAAEGFTDASREELVEINSRCQGFDQGITGISYSASGLTGIAVVLSNEIKTGNFWKRISAKEELIPGDTYLIVSTEGGYALRNNYGNTAVSNKAAATLKPVKGNPGYYTADGISAGEQWFYGRSNRNESYFSNGGYRLDPSNTSRLFVKNNTYTVDVEPGGENCWTISTNYNRQRYYLNKTGENFYGNVSENGYSQGQYYRYAKSSEMLLFRLVSETLSIPDDVTGDIGGEIPEEAEKPRYPSYRETSEEKTGVYSDTYSHLTIQYDSDPSTSKLESRFGNRRAQEGKNDYQTQKPDDGKLLVDKSVIYKGDDYEAFAEYSDGIFGVALSALGQESNVGEEKVVAPLDVVFILDFSGSMRNVGSNGTQSRAGELVDAMNDALQVAMESHEANRVGIVSFNSGAMELLPLGRYTPDQSGRYLKLIGQGDSMSVEVAAQGAGGRASVENGTCMQLGIARGAAMLEKNGDTVYTTEFQGESITVKRKPVLLMVSDGEPTHCTDAYMDVLNSPYYGDGSTWDYNAAGVQGYYTILSANYYKRMVGIHYDNPAAFYTIGTGMAENNYGGVDDVTHATNHYKATILHPTETNIENLLRAQGQHRGRIEEQLYSLLRGRYRGNEVQVGSFYRMGSLTNPHSRVPVIWDNPYSKDYNYADHSFIGESLSAQDFSKYFRQILNASQRVVTEYAYRTRDDAPIEISDPIGVGMEVKGEPALRLNGVNYRSTGRTEQNNGISYTYTGVVPMDPYSGRTIDLSAITVQVKTDGEGFQTVIMKIPPSALPVYGPDSTRSFYYEALPVRLLYQVGLSKAGEETAAALKTGETAVFYTNRYENGVHGEGRMSAGESNLYYRTDNQWQTENDKTVNQTETDEFSLKVEGTNREVYYNLGNNGRLMITKEPFEPVILPETGGGGTAPFTAGGLLLAGLCLLYVCVRGKTQGREENESCLEKYRNNEQEERK